MTTNEDVRSYFDKPTLGHKYGPTVYPLIGNGVQGAVIRVDDITSQVRPEEMMVQSEKMMSVGGLAAGMAHEINNPLGGIMHNAQLVFQRLTDQEMPANLRAAQEAGITMASMGIFLEKRRIYDMLRDIRESGERAADIVQNMLSFARKENDISSQHSMRNILDTCLELCSVDYDLKKQYDFRRINILKEYEEDLPRVPCDAGKIQQVLMNILRNGAEAMHESTGEPRFILRLYYEKKTNLVRIEINDNGLGMSEDVRRRVFEPFFTTKPTGKGTGLGLSVSYFIVTDNHHGELFVHSEPGKGTTFTVGLPVESATRSE